MYTVVETPTFSRLAEAYWSEEERLEFVTHIAGNPLSIAPHILRQVRDEIENG